MLFAKKEENKNNEVSNEVPKARVEIRRHFIFRGRVQGVGFRYRASYVARARDITGWIKNNWDGSVEMEAQGTEKRINKMIDVLNEDRFIRIEEMDVKDIPIVEDEYGFHVRG